MNITLHKSRTPRRDISVNGVHGAYTYGPVNGRDGAKGWNLFFNRELVAYCETIRFVEVEVAKHMNTVGA